VFSACMVLMAAAVTVSSILSTIQLMKPIRILMDQAPVTAEYHPAKFVVSYKTLALDGSLQTVSQDSLSRRHRNLLQPNQQKDGEMDLVDTGHALDQVRYVTSVQYRRELYPAIVCILHYRLYAVYCNRCHKGNCGVCVRYCLFSNGFCIIVFFILQLVMSVDESLYQKSLQATKKEWVVDDDEAFFFYPKVRIQIFHC
jgi:ferredoxin